MEKVELASRLSVFDSFLFLVPDDSEKDDNNKCTEVEEEQTNTSKSVTSTPSEQAKLDAYQNRDTSTPIHESNVRCIPGSAEEKRDLAQTLSAFDKYMFLLNDTIKDEDSKTDEGPKINQVGNTQDQL